MIIMIILLPIVVTATILHLTMVHLLPGYKMKGLVCTTMHPRCHNRPQVCYWRLFIRHTYLQGQFIGQIYLAGRDVWSLPLFVSKSVAMCYLQGNLVSAIAQVAGRRKPAMTELPMPWQPSDPPGEPPTKCSTRKKIGFLR